MQINYCPPAEDTHNSPNTSAKSTKENVYTTMIASCHALLLLVHVYCDCILINWCTHCLYNCKENHIYHLDYGVSSIERDGYCLDLLLKTVSSLVHEFVKYIKPIKKDRFSFCTAPLVL